MTSHASHSMGNRAGGGRGAMNPVKESISKTSKCASARMSEPVQDFAEPARDGGEHNIIINVEMR